jgi:hypothetical protein
MTRPRPFEIQRAFHIVAQPYEMGSGGWSRKTSARNATHFRSQGVCLAGGWHMRGFVTQQPISVIMPSHLRTPGDTITWRRAFPSALTCTHDASYVGKARRQGGLAASSLAASLASPGSQIGIALQTPFPGTPSADFAHCCAIPYRSGNGHPNPNPQSFPPGTSRITNARSQHQVANWHIPC